MVEIWELLSIIKNGAVAKNVEFFWTWIWTQNFICRDARLIF
jgi:hypothetical protein